MKKKIEHVKKMKRTLYFRIGLQFVALLLTVCYEGIPGEPLLILLQASQSVVAAVSGALIYALFADMKEATSLEKMYQQADGLSNGRNFQ